MTAVASVLTIALGLGSNKIIALLTGASGVAVLALYRSLTNTVTATLSFGTATVVVQRISTAETEDAARRVLRLAWFLFILQMGVLAVLVIFAARPLAGLMFDSNAAEYVAEVRVVLALVGGVMALQLVTALLNGRLRLRRVMELNVLTASLTLLAAYPLVAIGDLGLAMVIGLTCAIGALVGAVWVWREYSLSLADLRPPWGQWRELRAMPTSLLLTIRTVVGTVTMFALQFTINRHYGTISLGMYSAAAMIESSVVQVLASAMIPYYLPALGKLRTQDHKDVLVNKMLSMLLCISLPGVLLLVSVGGLLIPLLFRGDFAPAVHFLPILGISIVAQTVVWCFAVFLQHHANYRAYLVLDTLWAAVLLGGVALCVHQSWSLQTLLWVYTLSYCISGAIYVVYSRLMYSHGLLDRGLMAIIAVLALAAAMFLAWDRLIILQLALAGTAMYAFRLFRRPDAPAEGV